MLSITRLQKTVGCLRPQYPTVPADESKPQALPSLSAHVRQSPLSLPSVRLLELDTALSDHRLWKAWTTYLDRTVCC